jgi:hypothetical protein
MSEPFKKDRRKGNTNPNGSPSNVLNYFKHFFRVLYVIDANVTW